MLDNRSIATRMLIKGDRVRHPDYGLATVVKTDKKSGATWVKMDEDDFIGTCCAEILRKS